MDDIAERADVARATVFNHFPREAAFIDERTAAARNAQPPHWASTISIFHAVASAAPVAIPVWRTGRGRSRRRPRVPGESAGPVSGRLMA
jgi:hypothetical protein